MKAGIATTVDQRWINPRQVGRTTVERTASKNSTLTPLRFAPSSGRPSLGSKHEFGVVLVTDSGHVYRPDVDGLRAIAVGSVVLFHAFPWLVPGGYVGVDIFFVISGFLITTNIVGGLSTG
ncbi:MAG: hypothetical protein RIS33_246, partial [Actinomycetota bacterium]